MEKISYDPASYTVYELVDEILAVIPSYFKIEILVLRYQTVMLGTNGLRIIRCKIGMK